MVDPTPTPVAVTFPPDRKVWASGLSGLAVFAIGIGLQKFFNITIDPNVLAAAITVIIPLVAYLVPPSVQDVVKRVNNDIVKIANADQSNPTQAVAVDLATSKAAAISDIVSGAIPPPPAAVSPVFTKGP